MKMCRHFWVYREVGGGLECIIRLVCFMCHRRLIHVWDMAHSYMRLYSFLYETWLILICDMTHSYMRHDSFLYETWLIHICDMTPAYMRHDAMYTWDATHTHNETWRICAYATWLILVRDMTHPRMKHDSFTHCVQFIRTWDTTPSHTRHDSSTCETWRAQWKQVVIWLHTGEYLFEENIFLWRTFC